MEKLERIGAAQKKWYRFWLGTRFLIMFQSPDLFETVMNSPHAMDKGNVYKIVGNSMGGNGLITSSGWFGITTDFSVDFNHETFPI